MKPHHDKGRNLIASAILESDKCSSELRSTALECILKYKKMEENMNELNEEDYKEFKNFENNLLNQESNVKYKADEEINAIVRNDVLTAIFGKENFKFAMGKLSYSSDDLGKDEKYNIIYEFLNRWINEK